MSDQHVAGEAADEGSSAAAGRRIQTLDIVRGVAVMGILAMNIIAFSMPVEAYVNPRAYGLESAADLWSWIVSFIFIDGRMRGLFSFLFGASMLLVIQRADHAGEPPEQVHFSRMAWLLLFGLFHFYFIWWGDILALYAPVGMIAFFFRRLTPRRLIQWGTGLVVFQLIIFAGLAIQAQRLSIAASLPGATADSIREWRSLSDDIAIPDARELMETLALYRGSYAGILSHRLTEELTAPIVSLVIFGWETLGFMLLGMAGLKTGFLTGSWDKRRYGRIAAAGFLLGAPVYALLAWILVRSNFSVPGIFAYDLAVTTALRPIMIVAWAALIIYLCWSGGALVDRIAAAGRAAFTNYLATSIVLTTIFYGYGFGLYGRLSRAELWLAVVPMWALMLLWSKPWLDRFHYGPFEWLWRSLARRQFQPMTKTPPPPAE